MADKELNNLEVDVLKEIGNIGAGNATTALSVLLGDSLRMDEPVVKMIDFDDIPELVGGAETIVVATLTHFLGDVHGMTLFIIQVEEAKNLVGNMLGKTFDGSDKFDDMDKSALIEIGNILMSSYISSIGTLTNLELRTEPPAISVDMAASVLSMPISELGKLGDKAMIIDSRFLDNDKPINGFLMYVMDEESYEQIFKALGIG